jgi:hypothetical protein
MVDSTPKPNRYDTPAQVAQNMARWREAMEISHAMLMAGLRDRVGPDGDVQEAYRQWNRRRREKKLQAYEEAAARYWKQQRKSGEELDAT